MNAFVRHRLARLALACALVSSAWSAFVLPASAGEHSVRAATRRLEGAERRLDQDASALDAAADAYERAHAHHLRLAADQRRAAPALRAGRQAERAAERSLSERVVEAYKHPLSGLAVVEAVLDAPDAGAALHGIDLSERVASQAAARLAVQRSSTARLADLDRQQRVLVTSTRAAARQSREAAQQLERAVAAARGGVAGAEQALEGARAEAARQRAEAARREAAAAAAREAAARAAARAGGLPPSGGTPSVTGAVCPVGLPNGFIDSWGFPRSGGRTHEGVDIFAAHGTPVYAVEAGVTEASTNTLGGQVVYLRSDDGDTYYYAHLAFTSVTGETRVPAGTVLGGVGTSGNAAGTPPHLHWQYHPGAGEPVNPFPLAISLCR